MCWIRNTYRLLITFNCSINIYSNWTVYRTLIRLIKTCLCSRNSSRLLNNTIFRIFITDISIYLNTSSITYNFIIYRNTISFTIYSSSILIKTCIISLDISTYLINTILRLINITNIAFYINTAIRTIN